MFIVSRHRGPVVTITFLIILALGTLFRWQESVKEEEQHEQDEKALFFDFDEKAQKALKLTPEQKSTGMLFEVFKCRKPSKSDKNYCNKVADKFYQMLTEEQRKAFVPIVEEYFSK